MENSNSQIPPNFDKSVHNDSPSIHITKGEAEAINQNFLDKSSINRNELQKLLSQKTQEKTRVSISEDINLVAVLQEQLEDSEKARAHLQDVLTTTESDLNKTISNLFQEKQQTQSQRDSLQNNINLLEAKLREQENLIKTKPIETVQTITIETVQPQLLTKLQQQIDALKTEKNDISKQYQQYIDTTSKDREAHLQQNKQLSNKTNDLSTRLSELQKQNDILASTNNHTNQKCTTQAEEIRDLKETIRLLKEQLKDKANDANNCQEYILKITTLTQQLQEIDSKYRSSIEALKSNLSEATDNNKKKDTQINTLKELLQKHNSALQEFKDQLCKHQAIATQNKMQIESLRDQNKCASDCKKKCAALEAANISLKNELSKVMKEYDSLNNDFNSIANQSTKAAQDNQTLIAKSTGYIIENKELKKRIASMTGELEELKTNICVLESQLEEAKKHQPLQDDPIDQKLYECLRKYTGGEEKLDINFVRQSKGVYMFGTQKIIMKLEYDQLIVRVGGGFCTLDEFLKIHTPIELEKLKKSNVMKNVCAKMDRVNKSLAQLEEGFVTSPQKEASHVKTIKLL